MFFRLDPSNRDAREGLNRLDPTANRNTGVNEASQVTSYDIDVDNLDVDDDDDDHDVINYWIMNYELDIL